LTKFSKVVTEKVMEAKGRYRKKRYGGLVNNLITPKYKGCRHLIFDEITW